MIKQTNNAPHIWLIAGEPSGDLIGARLMNALKRLTEGQVRLSGIGGESMREEGLCSLFPISDIALMGLVEILPRLHVIRKRIHETVAQIVVDQPDVVVSIDAPGFCYDVWKGLRKTNIPLIHYVAPSVWAWRPDRAKKFAAELDHLLALLPFEPQYFLREGLRTTFVGHPVIEIAADRGNGLKFRSEYSISLKATVICVLPGSRRGEITKLLKIFKIAAQIIVKEIPDAVFLFPTVSYMKSIVMRKTSDWPNRVIILETVNEKFDAMAASNIAMAASGTVSLELGIAGVPHVIAYKMNMLTVLIFRALHGVKQKYANLVNILLDKEIVPELITDKCRSDLIADKLLSLVQNEGEAQTQIDEIQSALKILTPLEGSPSEVSAKVVLSVLNEKGENKNE